MNPIKGLVLGAGGARGFAHLGFLQVLDEEMISMDLVVGCSAGAIFGALWCAGMDLYRIERLLTYPGFAKKILDPAVSKEGLIKGDRILEVIRLLTKDMSFADLKIPLAIVATDLETGELVVFREGSVAQAVRASISIPGFFKPYRYQGRLLVDGAVKNRLPVHVAREMGADKVLAVDVKKGLANKLSTAMDILLQSIEILEDEVFRTQCYGADLLLQPDIGHIGSFQFDRAEEGIRLGRNIALTKCSEIKRIMA
ncbi:patatin-like phospholipase family protein [Desulfosporosinus nitroreducens]|uniref:Patatin-like phospholipase family protein n=1 Tax=Desulfosporosinus nitroreducens TaxID=2018668 RepID=A0ABT8QK56_9FIRM|nr:patatin-like phospholipase family protein [Desulfosporosinus nitroreducens]MDO0821645.1 patatin-like phospholipase family protein [Desulfosporosinus nitroreducens]